MSVRLVAAIILTALAINGISVDQVSARTDDAVTALHEAAKKGAELRIFHFPDLAETFVAVTPSALRSIATFRTVITRKQAPQLFVSLARALEGTTVRSKATYVDLRWGCEICSAAGRPLGSFYLDGAPIAGWGSWRYGVFNGATMVVNDSLYRWFKTSFPGAARL
jgi:hypothetical protein